MDDATYEDIEIYDDISKRLTAWRSNCRQPPIEFTDEHVDWYMGMPVTLRESIALRILFPDIFRYVLWPSSPKKMAERLRWTKY